MNEVDIRFDYVDFARQLEAIKADFRKKAVRGALRSAAGVLRRAVVAFAPQQQQPTKGRIPGTLKRAVYAARSRHGVSGVSERYFIGIRQGVRARKTNRDAFYWFFLEHGWAPRGPGKALRGGARTKALQRRRAAEAGARFVRYPFIAPAFKLAQGAAQDRFEEGIEKAVRRYSAGGAL